MYFEQVGANHMWLLSIWSVPAAGEELNSLLYLILLSLNFHMCLVATVLDSLALDYELL